VQRLAVAGSTKSKPGSILTRQLLRGGGFISPRQVLETIDRFPGHEKARSFPENLSILVA
jgi:hypothetical protein